MNNVHPIFQPLLSTMTMERDDYIAETYDQADEMDLARWHQIELEEEREANIEAALTEAKEKGVSVESLRTLARESGALRWSLANSLKG